MWLAAVVLLVFAVIIFSRQGQPVTVQFIEPTPTPVPLQPTPAVASTPVVPTPTPVPNLPSRSEYHLRIRKILDEVAVDIGFIGSKDLTLSKRINVKEELSELWNIGEVLFKTETIPSEQASSYADLLREIQELSKVRISFCDRWDLLVGTPGKVIDSRYRDVNERLARINRDWAAYCNNEKTKLEADLQTVEQTGTSF